jgi:hypothetical protein
MKDLRTMPGLTRTSSPEPAVTFVPRRRYRAVICSPPFSRLRRQPRSILCKSHNGAAFAVLFLPLQQQLPLSYVTKLENSALIASGVTVSQRRFTARASVAYASFSANLVRETQAISGPLRYFRTHVVQILAGYTQKTHGLPLSS